MQNVASYSKRHIPFLCETEANDSYCMGFYGIGKRPVWNKNVNIASAALP